MRGFVVAVTPDTDYRQPMARPRADGASTRASIIQSLSVHRRNFQGDAATHERGVDGNQ